MSRPGYLNIRLTPARASNLDALRRFFGPSGRHIDRASLIDYAIEWTLASSPERYTKRTATRIMRTIEEANSATAAQAKQATSRIVRTRDLGARAALEQATKRAQ